MGLKPFKKQGVFRKAHLNPAVTIGFRVSGSIGANKILPYIASQLAGAIVGAAVLYIIVTGSLSVREQE